MEKVVKSKRSRVKPAISHRGKWMLLRAYLRPSRPSVEDAVQIARMSMGQAGIDVRVGDHDRRRYLEDFAVRHPNLVGYMREGGERYPLDDLSDVERLIALRL